MVRFGPPAESAFDHSFGIRRRVPCNRMVVSAMAGLSCDVTTRWVRTFTCESSGNECEIGKSDEC